jgi:hypothetical protein
VSGERVWGGKRLLAAERDKRAGSVVAEEPCLAPRRTASHVICATAILVIQQPRSAYLGTLQSHLVWSRQVLDGHKRLPTLRPDPAVRSSASQIEPDQTQDISFTESPLRAQQVTMVVQVIESRYTVDYDVLVAHLESIFKPRPYEIIVRAPKSNESTLLTQALQLPDEGEKWKVNVPRELTRVGQSNSSGNGSCSKGSLISIGRAARSAETVQAGPYRYLPQSWPRLSYLAS